MRLHDSKVRPESDFITLMASIDPSMALIYLDGYDHVTLNTLRKVIGFLPNLEEFTFEQVRMKSTYINLPPFQWQVVYANMDSLHETLDGVKTALRESLDNPPSKEVDPEVLTKRATTLATEILKQFARLSRQENAKRRKTAPRGEETAE